MDRLPELVLIKIISYLEFEQLRILGYVSPKIENLVNERIANRPLWIKKLDDDSCYLKLFCVKKVLELKELNVSRSLLQFKIDTNVHSLIKKLIIYNPFVLEHIKLDQLVHLEIKNEKYVSKGQNDDDDEEYDEDDYSSICSDGCRKKIPNLNLNFKNLRTLNIDIFCKNFLLLIESPALLQLRSKSLNNVRLVNPKTVKTLSTLSPVQEISDFRNLSKLFIYRSYDNNKWNLIKSLSKLRELQIYYISNFELSTLRNQKNELNNKLKIYLKNIDIDSDNFEFDLVKKLDSSTIDTYEIETYTRFADSLKGEFIFFK